MRATVVAGYLFLPMLQKAAAIQPLTMCYRAQTFEAKYISSSYGIDDELSLIVGQCRNVAHFVLSNDQNGVYVLVIGSKTQLQGPLYFDVC